MVSLRSLFGKAGAARQAREVGTRLDAGIARYEAGDLEGARREFDAAIALSPEDPRALHLKGVVALARGEAADAESLIRRAIAGDRGQHVFWFNLGNALVAQARPADSADAFAQAAAITPDYFPAWFNLACARLELGDFDAAMAAVNQMATLSPGDPATSAQAGIVTYRKAQATGLASDFDDAIVKLRQALGTPGQPEAEMHNARVYLADALGWRGRSDEALPLLKAVHADTPDDLEANILLANCLNTLGRIRDAAPLYSNVVRLAPGHLPAISSAISAAEYANEIGADEKTVRRQTMMRAFDDPRRCTAWPNTRDPDRRVRIGYVSPDFREHVAMTLFEDVLRRHDHDRFEVFAYDCGAVRDAKNLALRSHADHWRDIAALDTASVVDLIRADAIDLLVDLAGHTAGNRLMVFARKPAPIAATWLAYPGSTGLPEIDYLVSDAYTSPSRFAGHASETVWRLPATRLCFTPPSGSPAPRMPAADAPVTFACFNNVSKINPDVLALWKRVLEGVPGSRLVFKYGSLDGAAGRALLARDIEAAGIDPARVHMRGKSSYLELLGEYGDVHVALDPFPYCGGLSSLDALWMGVPVVTLEQTLMAGRQTGAFLHAIGKPEMIAGHPDDYVRIAVALATDRARIAACRNELRAAMLASPLLDYDRFTRDLEAAWRAMWACWCAGQHPAHPQD